MIYCVWKYVMALELFKNNNFFSFIFSSNEKLVQVILNLDWLEISIKILKICPHFICTMKIFLTFQSLVHFIFPRSNWTWNPTKNYPYRFVNFLPCLYLVLCFILCFNFLTFKAETFQEYSDCYAIFATMFALFNGTTVFINRAKYFDFIVNIENIIEKRKLNMHTNCISISLNYHFMYIQV